MSEQTRPTIDRRAVLLTGGAVVVAGTLVACGGGDTDAAAEPDAGAATGGGDSTSGGASASGAAVAKLADIPVGGGLVIPTERIVLTQPAAGEVHAFSSICPHQGCQVDGVSDNTITCPCHFSAFSAQDGAVINGPAPTGLTIVPVSVQGDDIVLG